MLVRKGVFACGNSALTDDVVKTIQLVLDYDDSTVSSQIKRARNTYVPLAIATGLSFSACFWVMSVELFGLGILFLTMGVAVFDKYVRLTRRRTLVQQFQRDQPARLFIETYNSFNHRYWHDLVRSFPNYSSWMALEKEMLNRTPVGEVLNGMIARELTATLPRLEDEFMTQEYEAGEDVPNLDGFWTRRAAEFGQELSAAHHEFNPKVTA